jgi:putative flippase GtrA
MYILARLHFHYVAYTAIAYSIAFVNSFMLNLLFTFKVNGFVLQRARNFFLINLANLGVVELIECWLIEQWHLPHLTAILIGMGWYIGVGFFMNQRYVYNLRVAGP